MDGHILTRPRALLAMLLTALAGTLLATPAAADEDALPEMAFVVNAFDFPDALASAAVGGSVGGPVILTVPDELSGDAEDALAAADPDLVVVVGGTGVVEPAVEDDLAALGYDVERVAGAQRLETAAELVDFAEEQGFDRPVVTGREVEAGTVPGLDAELLQGLAPDDLGGGDDVEDRLDALEAENEALREEVDDLTAKLDGVERTEVGDRDTLRFSEMNLQLVDGSGSTDFDLDDEDGSGLGNLIIGYHEQRDGDLVEPAERHGAHYLVVGDEHAYTGFGGIVAGRFNTASGAYATVTGGFGNEASGEESSVTSGRLNTASEQHSAVTGGRSNDATGGSAAISGGIRNEASGNGASVSGGQYNLASGTRASVSGGGDNDPGDGNVASGPYSSVSGGQENEASGRNSSVTGGQDNEASRGRSSVAGGRENEASGIAATVLGGRLNEASGANATVVGGGGRSGTVEQGNTAAGDESAILGGTFNEVDDDGACSPGCD